MADAADSGAPPWLPTPTQHPPFEDLASMEEQDRKSSPGFFSRGVFVLLIVCGLCFIPAKPPTLVSLNVDARVWELLRLLFVGVVVSYGVLGRRNVVVVSHSGKSQKIASFDGEASFKSWNNRRDHSVATASVSEDDGVVIRSRQPSLPVRSLKGGNLERKIVERSEFLDYSDLYSSVVGSGSNGGNEMVFDGSDSEKMRNYDSKSEDMRMRKEQLATFSQASPFLELNSFAASLFSEEIYTSSSLAPENNGISGDFLANKEKRSSHSPPSRIMLVENKNHQPQAVAKSSPLLIEEHMSKEDEQEELEVKISEKNIQNASDLLSETLGWEIRDEQYSEEPLKARSHRFGKNLMNDFSMVSKSYNQSNEEISKVSPTVTSDWEDEGFDSEILESEASLPPRNKEAIVGKTKDLSSQPSMPDTRGRHRSRSSDGKHSSADYVSLAKHPKEASRGSTVEMPVRTRSKKTGEDTGMDDGKKYEEHEAVIVKKREMKIDRTEKQHTNKPEKSSRRTHRSRSKKPMEELGKESITKSKHYDAASVLASTTDNKDSREATSSKHAMNAGLEANEVDKKADEFIAKFRAQIRDQKAESVRKSNRRRMEKQLK